MLAKKLLAPTVSGGQTLYEMLTELGYTSGLQLCLDAADSASYPSGYKWLDTAGGGYDFYLGSSTDGDAAEPTFNGSAGGLSENEYWSFDGGDGFLYDTAIETWMQNLSRNNATWSMIVVLQTNDRTGAYQIFTTKNALIGAGMGVRLNSTNGYLAVECSDGTNNGQITSTTVRPALSSLQYCGIAFDESVGAGGCKMQAGSTTQSLNSTYIYPSTSGEQPMSIGSRQNIATFFASGMKMACFALWNTDIGATALNNIYTKLQERYTTI